MRRLKLEWKVGHSLVPKIYNRAYSIFFNDVCIGFRGIEFRSNESDLTFVE
jgi:hypothetical protein